MSLGSVDMAAAAAAHCRVIGCIIGMTATMAERCSCHQASAAWQRQRRQHNIYPNHLQRAAEPYLVLLPVLADELLARGMACSRCAWQCDDVSLILNFGRSMP